MLDKLEEDMINFEIDPQHITSVSVFTTFSKYATLDNPTAQDTADYLAGRGVFISQGTDDHPEFAKLRNLLEEQGFISINRNWWNGDRVLKPFSLNNVPFKKNDKFLSSSAMKYRIINHMNRIKDKQV